MVLGMIEFDCCGTSKQKYVKMINIYGLLVSHSSTTEIQCPRKLFCVIVLWLYGYFTLKDG